MASPCWRRAAARGWGPAARQGGSRGWGFGSRRLGWAGQPAARSSSAEGGGGPRHGGRGSIHLPYPERQMPFSAVPILVTAHNPKAHPALRFALLSPQVRNFDGCSWQSLPSGMCVVVCMWWKPQLRSDGRLQVRGSRDVVCIQIPSMHKLPCKTNCLGPYFQKKQLIGPKRPAVPWPCS